MPRHLNEACSCLKWYQRYEPLGPITSSSSSFYSTFFAPPAFQLQSTLLQSTLLHSTPTHPPLLHSTPLTGSVYLLHIPSASLQGPNTPAHTDNTGSHSHPSGGSSESSINRLNPHTSSIASPVVINGDSRRDDGTVHRRLVLLVWDYCASRGGDGWLCWGTDISLFRLYDMKRHTLCY
jgi:hypothetical protein